MKQPVLEARACDRHMVGKLEATLEGARGDALVQDLALAGLRDGLGLLRAPDRQRVLAGFDREIALGEAGDGDGDAIGKLVRSML